jgi:hypothetical protein
MRNFKNVCEAVYQTHVKVILFYVRKLGIII